MRDPVEYHPHQIFERIMNKKFKSSCCFLCGINLTSEVESVEHIFPKWLQEKFNLWDKKLILSNGTSIPYRSLTIPCCIGCNTVHLSKLESYVKSKCDAGYQEFQNMDRGRLFLWLGKMFYGILYKELFLPNNRKQSKTNTIASVELLESVRSLALFLQQIRERHQFEGFFPASIFVVETKCLDQLDFQWDFFDDIAGTFIGIRMGTLGVIANLRDAGAIEETRESLKQFFQIPLHPLQFQELAAHVAYRSLLLSKESRFVSDTDGNMVTTRLLPLHGLSNKPLFGIWNASDYARVLARFTRLPFKELNPSGKLVWSWMIDENDKIREIDISFKHDLTAQGDLDAH